MLKSSVEQKNIEIYVIFIYNEGFICPMENVVTGEPKNVKTIFYLVLGDV